MRKGMKGLLAVLFVCLLSVQLFAADGTVTYVKGKVEVKRGGSWVSLRVGDKVSQSEIINTGFQSEAKVKLMGSVLYLGPVTRVTLDQLASDSKSDKVNVFLSTGSVRSEVNRSDNKRVNYTVRTPIAVASVRGTGFSMDDRSKLHTYKGKVAYSTTQDLDGRYVPEENVKEEEEEEDDVELSEDDGVPAKTDEKKGPAKKSAGEIKMENSESLPKDNLIVVANHSVSYNDANKFGAGASVVAQNAMNIVSAVSQESTKSSVSQSNQSIVSAVTNAITGGATSSPKTGSIKVQIAQPSTGNVSVEVVLP